MPELPIRKGMISGNESINQEAVLEGNINNTISDPSEAKSPCYTNRRNETLTSKGGRSKSFGDERERLSLISERKTMSGLEERVSSLRALTALG